MRSGTAYPPTLPEIVAYATKPDAAPRETFVPPPNCTPAEMLANRWFMHRVVRQRFAGIDNADCEFRTGRPAEMGRETLAEIREQAVQICEGHLMLLAERDPDATQDRVLGFLDRMAEGMYPKQMSDVSLARAAIRWQARAVA